MTSLQRYLPPPGSSNWDRSGSFSREGEDHATSVRHAIIREVWLEKRPSPHAVYKIEIMSQSSHWFVFRRYKEFYNLHQRLAKKFGIPKDFLPPRKLTNNMSIETLETRREALEHYLQRLINSCDREVSSCPELLEFLDLKGHDVSLVVMSLTKYVIKDGERILRNKELFSVTPVQLHCLTKQLQLPHPPKSGETVDLGHLYDFASQLIRLCITDLVSKASNGKQFEINYSYDLTIFSKLTELQIDGCRVASISGIHALPQRLTSLTIRYCIHTMKELLIDCAAEKRPAPAAKNGKDAWRTQAAYRLSNKRVIVQPWICLTYLNMSHNNILGLDNSMSLLPALRELDLSYNKMAHLDLSLLEDSPLQKLILVGNEIYLISGSTKTLSNLKVLNLMQNRIQSIEGLLCAQGLTSLDLSHNSIVLISEIRKLAALEHLNTLAVTGNPMAKQKRHRIMIFASFRNRMIELDGKVIGRKEKAKLDAKFSTEDQIDFDDTMSISTVSDDDLDSGIDGHVPSLEPLLEEEDYIIVDKDVNLMSLVMGESDSRNGSKDGSRETSLHGSAPGSPNGSPSSSRRHLAATGKKLRMTETARSRLESFGTYQESLAANWKPGTEFGSRKSRHARGERGRSSLDWHPENNSGLNGYGGKQAVRNRDCGQEYSSNSGLQRERTNEATRKKAVNKGNGMKKNPSLTSFDKLVRNAKKKESRNVGKFWPGTSHFGAGGVFGVDGKSSGRILTIGGVDNGISRNDIVVPSGAENKNILILPEIDELKIEDCDEDELWNGEHECEAGTECDEISED